MDHFRATLLSLLALTAGASTLGALQRPPDRPNIVVYVADDLGWRDTGVYGNAAVRTPNIDRIARSGLTVRYAFVTSPQCSPSRISILSGRYPHTTRTEDLHTPTPTGVRILPSYLQSAKLTVSWLPITDVAASSSLRPGWLTIGRSGTVAIARSTSSRNIPTGEP